MKTAMIYRVDFKTKANGYHMDAGAEIFKALGQEGADAVMVAALSTTMLRDAMRMEFIRTGLNGVLDELIMACKAEALQAKNLKNTSGQKHWNKQAEQIDTLRIQLRKEQ